MTPLDLLLASLCAYRATRFVTRDSLTAQLRERMEVVAELRHTTYPVEDVHGVRVLPALRRDVVIAYVAELLLCSWRLSVHVSLLVVGALTLWPDSPPLTFAARVLAVAAVAGLLLDRDRS